MSAPSAGFVKDILTGVDNATFEPANIIAIVNGVFTVAAAFAGVSIYLWRCVAKDMPIDLAQFGTGLLAVGGAISATIASLGAAQRLRGDAK
jgi:hypothetical protein